MQIGWCVKKVQVHSVLKRSRLVPNDMRLNPRFPCGFSAGWLVRRCFAAPLTQDQHTTADKARGGADKAAVAIGRGGL